LQAQHKDTIKKIAITPKIIRTFSSSDEFEDYGYCWGGEDD